MYKHVKKIMSTDASLFTVNPALQYTTLDGWGTSLCWWANILGRDDWSDQTRNSIMDLLFTLNNGGLGLNVARYNIGGGDDPTHDHMLLGREMEGFLNSDGTYDWTRDAAQRKILNEAIKRGVNITEAFSNSPPYFMTNSGCSSGAVVGGQNNLKDDSYDAFAKYLVDVVKYFRDVWGITFNTLETINEPSGTWWQEFITSEGCSFDSNGMNRIIQATHAELQKQNATYISMSAPDEVEYSVSHSTLAGYTDVTISALSQINSHGYGGNVYDRTVLLNDAVRLRFRLWQSEYGNGDGLHSHSSMTSALPLARALRDDLVYLKPETWCMWQVCEDENVQNEYASNYGPIHFYFNRQNESGSVDETFWLTKQFYTFANFTRFIRPGYKLIESGSTDIVAAYGMDDHKLVLVFVNDTASPADYYVDLSIFLSTGIAGEVYRTSETENLVQLDNTEISNNQIYAWTPAESITTIVVPDAYYPIDWERVDDTDSSVQCYGAFAQYNDWQDYGGTEQYSNTPDEYAEFSFYGTGVRYISPKESNLGIADIYMDGVKQPSVDLYSPEKVYQQIIFEQTGLPLDNHILKVLVSGNKSSISEDTFIVIDA